MRIDLDHLLYAGPVLGRLTRELARTCGEAPTPGGRHLGFGTRNALIGLRPGAYLEMIAPDPDQDGGAFADAIAGLRGSELHAWCVRTDDPDALASRIEASGHGVSRRAMSRATPDGGELAWELLFAGGHDWGGAAPFFIAWGATPHPSERLGVTTRLRQLVTMHPDADGLERWLGELGLPFGPAAAVRVERSRARALRADLTGRRGPFALRGGGGGMRMER